MITEKQHNFRATLCIIIGIILLISDLILFPTEEFNTLFTERTLVNNK